MYVIASRRPLRQLRDDPAEIEMLDDLLSTNTIWLGPYNKADADLMLHSLQRRHQVTLDRQLADDIARKAGGHPGLVRAVFRVVQRKPAALEGALLDDSGVRGECAIIWHSFSAEEQSLLSRMAQRWAVADAASAVVDQLRAKGILGGDWASCQRDLCSIIA